MSFELQFTPTAEQIYLSLKESAEQALENRTKSKKQKTSKQEGLFKQVYKTLELLANNPRHPSLQTHQYDAIENPHNSKEKIFEAYAQNRTPGAYRVFWCYGPSKNQITIVAITPHP